MIHSTAMIEHVVAQYAEDRVIWPGSSQASIWIRLTEREFGALVTEIELLPADYPRPIIRAKHAPGVRAERQHQWRIQFPVRWIREWASTQRGTTPKG